MIHTVIIVARYVIIIITNLLHCLHFVRIHTRKFDQYRHILHRSRQLIDFEWCVPAEITAFNTANTASDNSWPNLIVTRRKKRFFFLNIYKKSSIIIVVVVVMFFFKIKVFSSKDSLAIDFLVVVFFSHKTL